MLIFNKGIVDIPFGTFVTGRDYSFGTVCLPGTKRDYERLLPRLRAQGFGDASLRAALRHEPHTQPLAGKLVESFGII